MVEATGLTIRKQDLVLYTITMAMHYSICVRKEIPMLAGAGEPPVIDEDLSDNLGDKVIELLTGAPTVILQGEEIEAYYKMVDFVAGYMSEMDEKMKRNFCNKFDQENKGFDTIHKDYIIYFGEVAIKVNMLGYGK